MDILQPVKKGIAYALISVFAVLGAFLIIYGSSEYGLGITHDSVAYEHAARSLYDNLKLEYFGYGSPFIQWPPLYPFLLTLGLMSGIEPGVFAMYINAVVYGAIILISGLWVFDSTGSITRMVVSGIFLTLAYPLYYTGRFMWSEILFILFCLISLIFLDNYTRNYFAKNTAGHVSLIYLAGAAVFAALASLTRYLGLTLIMAGMVILLAQKKKMLTKLLEIIFFGAVSSFPLLVWLARNFILTDTFTGGRSPSSFTFTQVFLGFFDVAAGWIMSSNYGSAPHIVIWVLIIFVLAAIVKQKLFYTNKNINKTFVLTVFILFYSVYLIITASIVAFDNMNTRLLSPLYPFFFLALIYALPTYIESFTENKTKAVVLGLLCSLIFLMPVLNSYTDIKKEMFSTGKNGSGFLASQWWKGSMIVEYVEEIPRDAMIISNNPDIIYAITGRIARFPPKPGQVYWYGAKRLKEHLPEYENVYLLWFASTYNDQILNEDDMSEYFEMIPVKEFPSGRIYKIIE